MKRLATLVFFIIYNFGFSYSQTGKQDVTSLFWNFVESQNESFTMLPRDKKSLLTSEDRYKVKIDSKNYYIEIVDERLSSGDGIKSSVFTYFGVKNSTGIIAISHQLYGGDEGGIGDGSNEIHFFSYDKKWINSTENILPKLTFKDFTDEIIDDKYNKIKYFYHLPEEGTDFIIFAVKHIDFRKYSNSNDDPFGYTYDKQYELIYNKRKYIGIIYKWDYIIGAFSEKERIPNTPENIEKYHEYFKELYIANNTENLKYPDYLPFTNKAVVNEADMKFEIENVEKTFEHKDSNYELDRKTFTYHASVSSEFMTQVYSLNNKTIVIRFPCNVGANCDRFLYYDNQGKLKLIKDCMNGNAWLREDYYYFAQGIIWKFNREADISYNNQGIGRASDNDLPVSRRIKFESNSNASIEEYDEAAIAALKIQLTDEARKLKIDTKKLHYLKGELDWKSKIKLEFNITDNGIVSGHFLNEASPLEYKLNGQINGEHFEMKVLDDKGNSIGVFKGYFVDDKKATGAWVETKTGKDHYFELGFSNTYSF
jgi:hypothetical protein